MITKRHGPPPQPSRYRVVAEGKVDESWSEWLGGFEIVSFKEVDGRMITVFQGTVIDQAALRGLLNRLWDLNLVVRSIQQIDPQQ